MVIDGPKYGDDAFTCVRERPRPICTERRALPTQKPKVDATSACIV